MKKYLFLAISLVFSAFLGRLANGEELRAKLLCKNGVCVPVANNGVDVKKVEALKREAARLKRAIDEADGRDRSMVEKFINDVNKLKEQVSDLQKAYGPLNSGLKPTQYQSAEAMRKAKEARAGVEALSELANEIGARANAAWMLAKHLAKQPKSNLNFELGAVGFGAWPFGVGGGLQATLVLPMRGGLWDVRLSGGLGATSTPGLGWLAGISLTRKLGKIMAIGPAMLAMGDEGDLTSDSGKWAFGGGLELRLKFTSRLHLVVTPFVGVSVEQKSEFLGSGWADAVTRTDCYWSVCGDWCHTKIIRAAGYQDYYDTSREVSLAVGGTLALTVSLF